MRSTLVPAAFEVGQLDVDLDIAPTWRGDVTVRLTSPEGSARPGPAPLGSRRSWR